jgi:hypothetical protein
MCREWLFTFVSVSEASLEHHRYPILDTWRMNTSSAPSCHLWDGSTVTSVHLNGRLPMQRHHAVQWA